MFEKVEKENNRRTLISTSTINTIIESTTSKKNSKQKKTVNSLSSLSENNSKIMENNNLKDFSDSKIHDRKILEYTAKIKKIHQDYYEENILYEDKKFSCLNKYLFKSEEKITEAYQNYKNWQFLRPNEISKNSVLYNKENPYNYEIRLGKYSSLNFLNALSCLTNCEFYEKIFVDSENLHMGYISCRFFKNGEWHYIIIDTFLPFSKESKKFLFSHNDNFEIFWVALLEKAYAKLHGNYEFINNLSFIDIIEDLTNGYVTKIDFLDKKNKELIESKKLFNYLMNFKNSKEKYFLICLRKNKLTKNKNRMEMGEYGILENFAHSILSLEDVTSRDFKFFRIRNFWGSETNWSGPFSKNSDEWDKYKNLRDEFLHSKKFLNDFQNIYFMKYDYFIKEFNRIYIIKIFDQKKWKNYSCQSFWKEKTLSGPPIDLSKKFPLKEGFDRKFTKKDSDSSWFNNPQFRIKVFKKTKLYISLIQYDRTVKGKNRHYIDTNFYVVKNLKGFNRTWEFPNEKNILLEANEEKKKNIEKSVEEDKKPKPTLKITKIVENSDQNDEKDKIKKIKRKISSCITLDIFENKKYGNYNLIVNTIKSKFSKNQIPFYIKIFSNNEVLFEQLPETIDYLFTSSWNKKTAGGPYYPFAKNLKTNSFWCLNPQYLINFNKPTYIKILLQKTGKNAKKLKTTKLGLSLNFLHSDKNLKYYQISQPDLEKKVLNKKEGNQLKILKKVQKYLNIPYLDKFIRKIIIKNEENFLESTYSSSEISCIFLRVLPVEGPLLIIPALERPDILCDFKLQIFTNTEIEIKELNNNKNAVIISEWTQYNSGGSHIYNEKLYSNPDKSTWSMNPVFKIKFLDFDNFDSKKNKINIRLNLCEKGWKSKVLNKKKKILKGNSNKKKKKNILINENFMFCFYFLKISKKF